MRIKSTRKSIPALELNEAFLAIRGLNLQHIYTMFLEDPTSTLSSLGDPYAHSFNETYYTAHWGLKSALCEYNYVIITADNGGHPEMTLLPFSCR
jgi:hypothetical protein